MVALVVKCSSIAVGRKQFIQSNINVDSSNLYRSPSFSILLQWDCEIFVHPYPVQVTLGFWAMATLLFTSFMVSPLLNLGTR